MALDDVDSARVLGVRARNPDDWTTSSLAQIEIRPGISKRRELLEGEALGAHENRPSAGHISWKSGTRPARPPRS
jgi:hypothetical protein